MGLEGAISSLQNQFHNTNYCSLYPLWTHTHRHTYKPSVEEHFPTFDPRHMWKGIQILRLQACPQTPTYSSTSLSDEFYQFYSHFELSNGSSIPLNEWTPPTSLTLSHSAQCTYSILSSVNARKAASPDAIPRRIVRACAAQWAQVFTDIFNLSLAQDALPTCRKTTTIIPVPKCTAVTDLNGFDLHLHV